MAHYGMHYWVNVPLEYLLLTCVLLDLMCPKFYKFVHTFKLNETKFHLCFSQFIYNPKHTKRDMVFKKLSAFFKNAESEIKGRGGTIAKEKTIKFDHSNISLSNVSYLYT